MGILLMKNLGNKHFCTTNIKHNNPENKGSYITVI